jgi:undecaprenyl-diphosphatase
VNESSQGFTEFLPISSSGHLVIGRALLGLQGPQLPFDILVHGATMAAIIVYFRGRIWRIILEADIGYVGKLLVAMVPIIVVGSTFGRVIERTFGSPILVSAFLVISGLGLASLYFVPRSGEGWEEGKSEPSWSGALWIGVAQAAAILPGISRSGLTIVSGIWLGMAPAAAA